MIILLLLSLISHNIDGTNNCFYNKVRNCFLDIPYHTIMKIRTKNHCKKNEEKNIQQNICKDGDEANFCRALFLLSTFPVGIF